MSAAAEQLCGEWLGTYQVFTQVVKVTQNAKNKAQVMATKLTGDGYVPAGEISWEACLDSPGPSLSLGPYPTQGKFFLGNGQVAYSEFSNPKYLPGILQVVSADIMVFHWLDFGWVEFKRDE